MWPIKNQSRIFPWVTFIQIWITHDIGIWKIFRKISLAKAMCWFSGEPSGNWKRIHAWYLIVLCVRWLNWPSIARSKFSIFFGLAGLGRGLKPRGDLPRFLKVCRGIEEMVGSMSWSVFACLVPFDEFIPKRKHLQTCSACSYFGVAFTYSNKFVRVQPWTASEKSDFLVVDGWIVQWDSRSPFRNQPTSRFFPREPHIIFNVTWLAVKDAHETHFKRFEKLMDPKQMLLQTQTWWSYPSYPHTFLRPPKLQNEFAHTYKFSVKQKQTFYELAASSDDSKVWVASTLGWF